MNNNILIPLIALIVGLLVGAGVIYKYKPRVVTETQVVSKDVVHNQIVTVTKVIKQKDGSEVSTTTATDTSVKVDNTVSKDIKAPNYHVTAGYDIGFTAVPSYSLQVEKRIAGPLFLGARAETRGAVGVVLGLEF